MKFMWLDWKTQPDESLGGTVYGLPHGKLLGGSSAINGLVHVRGNPAISVVRSPTTITLQL